MTTIQKNLLKQKYWEYLIPALAVASLLISCVITTSRKFLGNDDFLSMYLLIDPSFIHMINAWGDTFNQAPPLYFIVGWLWTKIFGNTEISLCSLSSVAISIALILVWKTLRNTYGFWATSLAILSVFCLSTLVLYYNAEIKNNSLFTTVCAWGFLQYSLMCRSQIVSRKILVANTLAHGAIVLTHLYGVFYSGAILLALLLQDIYYYKRFRLSVYLSVIFGWAFLIPLIPTLLYQSDNQAKWFTIPSLPELFRFYIFTPNFNRLIISLLLIAVLISILQFSRGNKRHPKSIESSLDRTPEVSLLILALAFMGVPGFTWIISKIVRPLLYERYIIPTIIIGWPILLAYLSSRIFLNLNPFNRGNLKELIYWNKDSIILLVFLILLIVYPVKYSLNLEKYRLATILERPGLNDNRFGYENLPIAVEAGHDFLPRFHYSQKPSRYFHILDWETAVKNTNSWNATGDYTHMSALKQHYPFINSIQSKDFLKQNRKFLVLNKEESVHNWFEVRVKNNPEYKTKFLGRVDGAWVPLELEVFLVEQKS